MQALANRQLLAQCTPPVRAFHQGCQLTRPRARAARNRRQGLPRRHTEWRPFARGHRCVVRSTNDEDEAARALKETAGLDQLIEMLLSATSQQEVAQLVAENIFRLDQRFWLRVATRNDTATTDEERQKLRSMADTVMVLVDAMVRKTEQQLSDSAKTLQDILVAAADENGEWYLPLTEQQVIKVRAALDRHASRLDEALLSNAFAWIKKCNDDRFDSMAQLIQKVLQLYAARALRGPEVDGAEGAINELIWAEEKDWTPLVRSYAASGTHSEVELLEAVQRRMEVCVLGLTSGSYAQRVQAEYLKELEGRVRGVFHELEEAQPGKQQ